MNPATRSSQEPRGVTTLDLMLFTAGFACGWVMHRNSALGAFNFYILPSCRGGFQSLLGAVWIGWLWAFVTGLAAAAIGRRFRYAGIHRPAVWLSIALAIVLFDSVYPGFRPDHAGSMDGETVWVDATDSGVPVAYELWSWRRSESRDELVWVALRLAMVVALIASAGWAVRARLSAGWAMLLLILISVLITLGPIRLSEALSTEISSSAPNPAALPLEGAAPWALPKLALHLDARAWVGYSIRAFGLVMIAILAVLDLVKRWRQWLWTEWAGLASAAMIAGCWVYDEFVARPAYDRTVRVIALASWIIVIALLAGLLIYAWASATKAIRRRTGHVPVSSANH